MTLTLTATGNAPCDQVNDAMILTIWSLPTTSIAGPDQLDIPGTSTTLAGNTPASGTGLWAIVSGAGGIVGSPTSPTSSFQGQSSTTYMLSWTITTEYCGSSVDTVTINFAFAYGDTLIDDRDGQSYPTVLTGDQCWMTKNMNIGTKINSTTGGYQQTDNDEIEKYCYNNDSANCLVYGGLYEWPEAMQHDTIEGAQGICPVGWHIPTDNEWKILEGTVDSQYGVGDPEWDYEGFRGLDAGGNLKEEGTVHWIDPNEGATNSSGFTGLPGGDRFYGDGSFYDIGYFGYLWSSSQTGTDCAWNRTLLYYDADVYRYSYYKEWGFSVRCLKDEVNIPLIELTFTAVNNATHVQLDSIKVTNRTQGEEIVLLYPDSVLVLEVELPYVVGDELLLVGFSDDLESGILDSPAESQTYTFQFATNIPCPGMPTVQYEGQVYNTVQIGAQCWFRENLNVGTMIVSNTGGFLMTDNDIIEKYCYDNNEANCDIYGGLYEWPEAMQYVTTEGAQGICPPGWHIPTDNEFKILEGTVDSQYPVGSPVWDQTGFRGFDAGGNLKEAGLIHWTTPNQGATNSSGFTGLPAGFRRVEDGSFDSPGEHGYFWSSSQYSASYAHLRHLYYFHHGVNRGISYQEFGNSVRCLKDCWPQPTQANAGLDQLNVPDTSTTLTGNTPEYGTGVWHITSGTGGVVADTTSPTSTFTGVADSVYSLTWTITTQCGSSTDTVVISFAGNMWQPCPGIPTVEYEGQVYNTVQIGDQCWFKENLNVGTKIISTQGGYQQHDNDTIEKYCYNNDEANCDVYGGLYEWSEAMQYVTTEGTQGICPAGWHIPTDGEYTALTDYLGGLSVAGGKMKSTGTIEEGTGLWSTPNMGATNESGFTGLPGGYRNEYYGSFYYLGYDGYFWSSSQYSTLDAWSRHLRYLNAYVYRSNNYKENGFSVRCLQDSP